MFKVAIIKFFVKNAIRGGGLIRSFPLKKSPKSGMSPPINRSVRVWVQHYIGDNSLKRKLKL